MAPDLYITGILQLLFRLLGCYSTVKTIHAMENLKKCKKIKEHLLLSEGQTTARPDVNQAIFLHDRIIEYDTCAIIGIRGNSQVFGDTRQGVARFFNIRW